MTYVDQRPTLVSGALTGTTFGILNDDAFLHWNGPIELPVPGGRLQISLSDAPFGDFFNGIVVAQFSVPEPGTIALPGIGLGCAFAYQASEGADGLSGTRERPRVSVQKLDRGGYRPPV